jgi:alkanesulfonate monooxygenase SsuD/methylene tetrahydromethanopterin reductase-like flavin-dependent oxidoreductase (luciferase family)
MSPVPLQAGGPPVWIGGFVEPAVRRAGRHADGYIAPQMGAGGLQRRIDWVTQETTRTDLAIAQSTLTFVAARDAAELVAPGLRQLQSQSRGWKAAETEQQIAPQAAASAPAAPPGWQPGQEWESADPGRAMAHDDEKLSHALVIGTPEECVEKLRPFVEVLGARAETAIGHLTSRLTYPAVSDAANAESIRLFATEVIPALRELAPARPPT